MIKNWEPLVAIKEVSSHSLHGTEHMYGEGNVPGPALAMDKRKGRSCLSSKFSSSNLAP